MSRSSARLPMQPQPVRWLLQAIALGALLASAAARGTEWPSIALPDGIQAFGLGDEVVVHGQPMRAHAFIASERPAELARWFHANLGQPLVENQVGEALVLGRAEGDFFLTVRLEPVTDPRTGRVTGTRGVTAVTHLRLAADHRNKTEASAAHWLNRLPVGSRLLSQMESTDGGRYSKHLVYTNGYGESLNRERITELLVQQGFALEREAVVDAGVAPTLRPGVSGHTLFFKGAGKEAMAVVTRHPDGMTSVVLSMISTMENFQ